MKLGGLKMANITCTIVKQIGKVSIGNSTWNKELNIVKWNDYAPKYDIRSWNVDHEKCDKGVTLTSIELEKLAYALKRDIDRIDKIYSNTKEVGYKNGRVKCLLCCELERLSPDDNKGWILELNIVRWGDNEQCFDVRYWNAGKTRTGKGVTLSKEEAQSLLVLYKNVNPSFTNNTIKVKNPGGIFID